MDNVCRESNGIIAHKDPSNEDEIRAYRENAWMLVGCGILLLPIWLMMMDGLGYYVRHGDLLNMQMLTFYFVTGVIVVLGAAISYAFYAERPGLQATAAGLVVVTATFWNLTALVMLLVAFFLFSGFWAAGGGRSSRMDPSYLPFLSGVGFVSGILMYTWLLNAPM